MTASCCTLVAKSYLLEVVFMIFHQPHNSVGNYNYNAFIYTDIAYTAHFHKNFELIYVLEGQFQLTVNGTTETVNCGEMALILSNQIHAFEVLRPSRIWVCVFSEEYVPRFAAEMSGKQGSNFVFTPPEAVRSLFLQQMIPEGTSVYMKKACFYAACDCYLQSVTLEDRSGKTDFVIGKVLDWISEHYAEEISLKELAQLFGYEYHYFSRLLRQEYAINFKQLVNRYRVEAAVYLLESTDLSITQIALQSGFQSIRSFNHVFRELVGCTPSAYQPGESSEQAHRERAILFDPALRKKMQSLPEKEASG